MVENNPLMKKKYASSIFFPRPDAPFGKRAKGVQDHLFKAPDGVILRLRMFWGPENAPVILFFHGNGETARDYDPIAENYRALPATLAVAEYRGYGTATGTPSLFNFLDDAHASLAELKSLIGRKGMSGPLVVMGRSLGSAPAIDIASTTGSAVDALIIESGFGRILPLLQKIGIPVHTLAIKEHHGPKNLEKMKKIKIPTLIMHGERDQIIAVEEAHLLHDACQDSNKALFQVPGAGHNDIQAVAGTAYFEHIQQLLARLR